jgi:beta-aspartyl-peptidase (threonine type)
MEFTGAGIADACHYVVHERNKNIDGDLGLIGVDAKGNIGIAFNSERMHRAWQAKGQTLNVKIYK